MNAVLAPERLPVAWPAPYDGMAVSEADYWAGYYLGHDVTYEWNDGILEEKGVSDDLTFRVYDWFIRLLIEFLNAHTMADRVGLMMGFRLALPNKTAIRRPDYKERSFGCGVLAVYCLTSIGITIRYPDRS